MLKDASKWKLYGFLFDRIHYEKQSSYGLRFSHLKWTFILKRSSHLKPGRAWCWRGREHCPHTRLHAAALCPLARDLNQTPLSFHLCAVSKSTGGSYKLTCTQPSSLPRVWVPTLFSSKPKAFIYQHPACWCLDTHQREAHKTLPAREKYLKKSLIFCNLSHYSLKSYNLTSKHIKLLKLLTLK